MDKIKELLEKPVHVANIGLFEFFESLCQQSVPTIHVDWRPPAGGNRQLQDVLARLNRKQPSE